LNKLQIHEGCAGGSWDPNQLVGDLPAGGGGRLAAVSLSCLGLEVYYRHLSLFRSDTVATGSPQSASVIQIRTVNKLVKDFPEKTDLSTPESAQAAWNRANSMKDAKAISELSLTPIDPKNEEEWYAREQRRDPEGLAAYLKAVADSTIVEVQTYRGELANVVSLLPFPPGKGRDPYSSRAFGKIKGIWKNLGEDRLPSLEAARENFDRKKDNIWGEYVSLRDAVNSGRSDAIARIASKSAPAPGCSEDSLVMMGLVEDFFMHNYRDITARKSLEWSKVTKDATGNRSIRYKYNATIWDRDVYVMNEVFTFDKQGRFVRVEKVKGFPQKKVVKPADVSTQAGMKDLVEDFFSKNFRDITSRETIEWGEVAKQSSGNSSIRYKYRAKIWDKDTKIMNQVFTFDPKGKFVSFKNVDGFPKDP
jgi:hypothetical protein